MTAVLHVLPQLTPGGAGRAALLAARSSAAADPRLSSRILSLRPPSEGLAALARRGGIEVAHHGDATGALAEIGAADVVHLHFWASPELVELLEAEWPSSRLLLWPHVSGSTPPQLLPTELIGAADMVVSNAGSSRLHLERAWAQARRDRAELRTIVAVGGWERLRDVRRSPRAGFGIAYIGTVGYAKLHPAFARLCAQIRVPDARFAVCGAGDASRSLPRLLARIGIGERFEFTGQVERIGSVLGEADVFGYPLNPDCSACAELVLQEAMYCAVPPVVLNAGGGELIVEHGETGLVVGEQDYAEAIGRLRTEPGLRRRLGERARAHAIAAWDPARAGRAWSRAYAELMREPKRERQPPYPTPAAGPTEGAERFLRGLGSGPEADRAALAGEPEELAAELDEAVAAAGPIVAYTDGGLLDHSRRYPGDPLLALWSGLHLAAAGRPALAAAQLARARALGCPESRLGALREVAAR